MRARTTVLAAVAAVLLGAGLAAGATGAAWTDVLAIAGSGTTPFGGSWEVEKGSITGKATRGGRLEIPLQITGSYELTLSLSPLSGKGFYGIRFPVGTRGLALTLFASEGREDLLDGTWRSEGTGKTSATPSVIKADKRHDIRIVVQQRQNLAKVTVTVDGNEHLSWQGGTDKICPAEIWGHTSAKTLSLGLWNGSVRFEALKVRMIAGEHRVTRPPPAPTPGKLLRAKFQQVAGVGRTDGSPFREAADKDGLLVGFSFRYAEKSGLVTLIPIFKTQDGIGYGQRRGNRQYPDEMAQTVLARDGFAVGGVIARQGTDRPVAAIKVVFMKIGNGNLDPEKAYESAAYGAASSGQALLLGGDGRAVIGIEGRSGSTIEQLSLAFR